MSVRMIDVHWTAGFLDGEGSFGLCGKSPRLQASQVDTELLHKLVDLWGGTISKPKKPSGYGKKPVHAWICGRNTPGLMMMLYPILSKKRQDEIAKTLISWQSHGAKLGDRHFSSKVKDDQALNIMRRFISGEAMTSLANEIGVSHTSISHWMSGFSRPYLRSMLEKEGYDFSSYDGSVYYRGNNDEMARSIMQRVIFGEPIKHVAFDTGIPESTISSWMQGVNRSHLLEKLKGGVVRERRSYAPRPSDEEALSIVMRVKNGEKIIDLSKKTGIKETTIGSWVRGESRKHLLSLNS